MKILLFLFLAFSSTYASETAQIDCDNFSNATASMEQKEKIGAAKSCKEAYITLLNEKIQILDKATDTCEIEIDSLRELVAKARNFYQTTTSELRCDHPDRSVEAQMQESMIDLIFALSQRIEERSCSHMDYVEAKADAQLELILLQETEVKELNV